MNPYSLFLIYAYLLLLFYLCNMKIAIAQLNLHVGNFESNHDKIIQYIKSAIKLGNDLVVFPELAICGYPPRDFLEFNLFRDVFIKKLYCFFLRLVSARFLTSK